MEDIQDLAASSFSNIRNMLSPSKNPPERRDEAEGQAAAKRNKGPAAHMDIALHVERHPTRLVLSKGTERAEFHSPFSIAGINVLSDRDTARVQHQDLPTVFTSTDDQPIPVVYYGQDGTHASPEAVPHMAGEDHAQRTGQCSVDNRPASKVYLHRIPVEGPHLILHGVLHGDRTKEDLEDHVARSLREEGYKVKNVFCYKQPGKPHLNPIVWLEQGTAISQALIYLYNPCARSAIAVYNPPGGSARIAATVPYAAIPVTLPPEFRSMRSAVGLRMDSTPGETAATALTLLKEAIAERSLHGQLEVLEVQKHDVNAAHCVILAPKEDIAARFKGTELVVGGITRKLLEVAADDNYTDFALHEVNIKGHPTNLIEGSEEEGRYLESLMDAIHAQGWELKTASGPEQRGALDIRFLHRGQWGSSVRIRLASAVDFRQHFLRGTPGNMASRGKAITVNWGLKLDGQPNTHTLSARPSARAIAAFNATQGAGSPFGPRSPQVEKQLQHISEAMQSIQQQQQRSQAPATWGSPSQTAEATAAIEYTRQRTEETFRLLQTVQADTAQVRAAVAAQERAIQGVQVTVTGARQDIHQQGVTQGQYHQEQLAAHGNNSRLLQSFQGAITNYLAEETRRTQPQAAPTPPAPHSTAHSAERCPTWPVAALFPGEPPAARRVHFSPDTPMEAPPIRRAPHALEAASSPRPLP